jgi:glutamyl-tRNA synthetase
LDKFEELFFGPVLLESISDWKRDTIHAALELGFGTAGVPSRLAATGGAPSPDWDLVIYLIGKKICLRRFDKALGFIKGWV